MTRVLLPLLLLLVPVLAYADAGHVVVQKNRRFGPDAVAIRAGESLVFTNEDEFIHQIYADDLFDSEERAPGQNITESFPRSGTFQVRCHIHPKMKLTVQVN